MIRVLIVEDQDIVRAGLRTILDYSDDFVVSAEASDGFAALEHVENTDLDVILMDLQMPGIDGVEVTRRVRASHRGAHVGILVLTTFEKDANVVNALHAGANGFLGKAASAPEILAALRSIAAGGHALSDKALSTVITQFSQRSPIPTDPEMLDRFTTLTTREREVLDELVRGTDSDGIAAKFFLSPLTVKTHINHAMSKVGARDRAQLISFAVRAGIMPLGPSSIN